MYILWCWLSPFALAKNFGGGNVAAVITRVLFRCELRSNIASVFFRWKSFDV